MRLRMSLNSPGRVTRFQQGIGFGVIADTHAEGLGHGIGGDVVMGGADAAGGENNVIAGPQRIQPGHDLILHIGNHADFLQVDAQRGQETGDIMGIAVLGAAGQDFVPDHHDGRCLVALAASGVACRVSLVSYTIRGWKTAGIGLNWQS